MKRSRVSLSRSHGGAVDDEPVLCQVSRLLKPSRCEVQGPSGLGRPWTLSIVSLASFWWTCTDGTSYCVGRPCSLAKHALKSEVSLGLAVCSGSAPHVPCQVDPSQDEEVAALVSCSSLLPVFGLMSSVLELAS